MILKVKLVSISALAFALIACVNTSSQTNSVQANLPTQAMATATGSSLAEIGEGHAIYMRHCSQCHEPKLPSSIPSKAWHVIVPGMAWNAGINAKQEKQVTAYIKAASKYSEMQKK